MGNKWKIASVAIIMVVSFFVWRTSHEEEPTYQALGEASSKQEIKNVETFTKLFGYIRYFHPSDEVDHLNWQRFSVYGIQEIMTSRDRFELKDRLEELFYPIAPSVQLYRKGEEPEQPSFDIKEKSELRKVFWQHNGVEPHGELHSTIYKSKRIYHPLS